MADKPAGAKKTKKQRKYGRNKTYSDDYKRTNRRERNKLRRGLRRLKDHPDDGCLVAAIAGWKVKLGIMK